MHRPGGYTVHHWHTGRGAACLERIVPGDWRGLIGCDGYAAYDAYARTRQGAITLASCMAHIRRGFHEGKEEAPQRAGWVLRQIAHLYLLENALRDAKAGPALWQGSRSGAATMILPRRIRYAA